MAQFAGSEFASLPNKLSSNRPEMDVNSNYETQTMNPTIVDSSDVTKSNESKIINQISSSHHSENVVHDLEIPTSPIDENNNNMVTDDISKRNFKIMFRSIFLVCRLV